MAEGREMLKEFLIIIQTYKSSGCVERGQKFYDHYSKVEGDFLKMRELVIKNKKPRRVELQTNLMRYNEKTISPVNYPECFEGLIHSFADRFPFNSELVDEIMGEWMPTKDHLRVVQ
jgi:dipeptidyl-peptidase-3